MVNIVSRDPNISKTETDKDRSSVPKTTNRKWPMANRPIRHVTLKGQGHDPNT